LTSQGHVTSSVTWPFDHLISQVPFPISAALYPSLYL